MSEYTREQLQGMFVWGAVGGMLPTLAKIAGTFGTNFDAPAPNWVGVSIALTLYGLLGAVMARAFAYAEMKQSLFAGIAAPAILAGALAGFTESKGVNQNLLRQEAPRPGIEVPRPGAGLLSSAYAQAPQQTTREMAKETKPFDVVIEFEEYSYPIEGVIFIIAMRKNAPDLQVARLLTTTSTATINVPVDAEYLLMIAGRGDGVVYSPPLKQVADKTTLVITVFPKPSVGGDLSWALGGKRVLEIAKLSARFK